MPPKGYERRAKGTNRFEKWLVGSIRLTTHSVRAENSASRFQLLLWLACFSVPKKTELETGPTSFPDGLYPMVIICSSVWTQHFSRDFFSGSFLIRYALGLDRTPHLPLEMSATQIGSINTTRSPKTMSLMMMLMEKSIGSRGLIFSQKTSQGNSRGTQWSQQLNCKAVRKGRGELRCSLAISLTVHR